MKSFETFYDDYILSPAQMYKMMAPLGEVLAVKPFYLRYVKSDSLFTKRKAIWSMVRNVPEFPKPTLAEGNIWFDVTILNHSFYGIQMCAEWAEPVLLGNNLLLINNISDIKWRLDIVSTRPRVITPIESYLQDKQPIPVDVLFDKLFEIKFKYIIDKFYIFDRLRNVKSDAELGQALVDVAHRLDMNRLPILKIKNKFNLLHTEPELSPEDLGNIM